MKFIYEIFPPSDLDKTSQMITTIFVNWAHAKRTELGGAAKVCFYWISGYKQNTFKVVRMWNK